MLKLLGSYLIVKRVYFLFLCCERKLNVFVKRREKVEFFFICMI